MAEKSRKEIQDTIEKTFDRIPLILEHFILPLYIETEEEYNDYKKSLIEQSRSLDEKSKTKTATDVNS